MARFTGWIIPAVLGFATVASFAGCDSEPPLAPDFRASAASGSGSTPTAPSNANAVAASFSQLNISWQDNSSNETGFELHRSTSGPSGAFTLLATTGPAVASYSEGGLTGSTQYCYKVRASRTAGGKRTYSAFSNTACATTPVPPPPAVNAPTGMTVVPLTSEHISVSWTDNSTNEDGFRAESAATATGPWAPIATFGPNTTSFHLGRLVPSEVQICFRVFAYSAQGTSSPSDVDCTTPPAPPTDLVARGVNGPAIDLTWTDNSAAEDGYEVLRRAPDEQWQVVADVPRNSVSYHDAGVVADRSYYYLVRARKDGGFSYSSNAVTAASASVPPGAPGSATAAPSSSTSISVSWLDNAMNEDGYRVERSTDGGASWVVAATIPAWGGPITDSSRTSETQACYRVFAFNSLGDSPASNVACTKPPAGPTDLVYTVVDDSLIDFTWTDNSAVEDGYELWVSGNCGFYAVASLPANATIYRLKIADLADPYWGYFFVVATKDGGYSDFSSPPPGGCAARPSGDSMNTTGGAS